MCVCGIAKGVSTMRVLGFVCFSCFHAAKADLGASEGAPGRFLAPLSRHDVSSSLSDDAGADYARETQSPMVWLNLHKSHLNGEYSWPSMAHEDYASQRLAETPSA